MLIASSFAEFLRDPIGRYVRGSSLIAWVSSPTLGGACYFGRFDRRNFPPAIFAFPDHPSLRAPFDAVFDCSALEAFGASAFSVLERYITELSRRRTNLRRVAVIRPAGMAGATTAGLFFEMVGPFFEAALFADRAAGFAWLTRPDCAAAAADVDRALEEVRGTPPILCQLRAHLGNHLSGTPIQMTAGALGLSVRSLQRRLAEIGTSYRAEVDRARVRGAETLLMDGETKLEAIARQIGCASPSHLAVLFRRATGETPSAFRERHRR